MSSSSTVQHPASVDAYIRHGWSLVPIPHGSKGPQTHGWNRREAALQSSVSLPPNHGIGLAHAYSGTMALDIDDWPIAASMLMLAGIDLQSLYDAPDAVVIDSGRPGHGKLIYSMPFGLALPSKKLMVDIEGKGKNYLDFRCATADGLTVQDVLPPTIHPQTQQPYRWAGRGHWSRLPVIPMALLNLWQTMLAEGERQEPVASTEVATAEWDEVRSALQAIPATCSRDEWISCGMAIHHAATAQNMLAEGYRLWHAWSASAPSKYPGPRVVEAQWRSFRSDKATVVRLGTLFALARRHGWTKPSPDASALFRPVSQLVTPTQLAAMVADQAPPAPQIDPSLWPEPLARRAVEVSEHVGCDPLIPLYAGLAAISGVADARSRLRLMEGYEVPPVVWLMVVGSPADKKSPGSQPMIEPLHTLESEDVPRWKKALLSWEAQEALYSAQKKDYLEAASTGIGMGELPPVIELPAQPQPLRIKVSDITSQKLVRYSADRPRGLLCFLDEMSAWTRKMYDRGSSEDRSAWVQAYEARRYEMDRVGSGSIMAETFAISVYGNIQPAVLRQSVEYLASDGLLQRFVPGILDTTRTRRGEPGPTAGPQEWEQIVRLVHSLPTSTYTLSPEAFDLFRQFQLWFEQSKRDEVTLQSDDSYLTAYGKLEGTTARITLLWHLIEAPFSTVVQADTLARAIRFTREYLIPALRYTLSHITTSEPFDAWVRDYLLYHCEGRESITLSDIRRGARRQLEAIRSPAVQDQMVLEAMEPLERAGWVIKSEGTSVRSVQWAINPAVAQAFADQRRKIVLARQRQQDERTRIAKLPRRIVAGYDPAWDDELQTGT